MNIGDRVRFIHSTEEGIIAKILDSQMVEVEIEDGFQIPAMKSELTLISREEKIWFSNKNSAVDVEPISNPQKKNLFTYQGIYSGFIPSNQSHFNLFLINNTDYELLVIVGIEKDVLYQTLTRSVLEPKSCIKLQDLTVQNIELWGTYIFQFLFYKVGNQGFKEPLIKRIRFRKSIFNTTLKQVPVLLKDGFFLQLDDESERTTQEDFKVEKNPAIDVERLKEAMFETKSLKEVNPLKLVPKPSKEIDLHIEELNKSSKVLDNLEMLTLQIQSFEKNLENAIANGMKEIIFIHGIGNGKLKTEIHKRLSKNPSVKFYEEARKEKFGYGATQVHLK